MYTEQKPRSENKETPKWKNWMTSMAFWIATKLPIKAKTVVTKTTEIRGGEKHIKALERLKTRSKSEKIEHSKSEIVESPEAPSTGYNLAKNILSPEGKKEYLEKLEKFLSSPEAIKVLDLNQKRSATFSDEGLSYQDAKKIRDQIDTELNTFDYGIRKQILNIADKRDCLKLKGKVFLTDNEARQLITRLISTATNKFKDYRDYFEDLSRVRPVNVENVYDYNILTQNSEIIEIPLNLIIGADSFVSWNGRASHISKDNRPSQVVINEYASMETSPTVEDLTMFVYPSGEIFFQTHNSHRVAAMKLRGDKTIDFKGVMDIVVMGKEDRVPVKENM